MSLPEVDAAVSVLLGLPPPATLSAATSSKVDSLCELSFFPFVIKNIIM